MKTIIYGLVLATVWTLPCFALRPFDGTDAGVAGPGEIELELGYLHYLREGARQSIVTPAAVVNFGFEKGNELVLEGRVNTLLHPQPDEQRTTLQDAAISIKRVFRNGVLQDAPGPSIASECGVLLPTVQGDRTGALCGAILRQRWNATTVHFNAALGKNREGNWESYFGAIIEGRNIGKVKPVAEAFITRDSAGGYVNSALVGFIWNAREDLAFDIALRKARSEESGITEIRAG